jgi:ABC-type branched-subunit amino acid transport system ATPase component
MSRLAVRGLAKRYGGISALCGAGFEIERPGIYGLIGPNGAGKTTLFDVIAGSVAPDEGQVVLDGRDVTGFAPHRMAALGIARTFQECRILTEETCLDNLLFAAQPKGFGATMAQLVSRSQAARRAQREEAMRLLALVRLEAYADAPAASLSFGQRRLLEIVSTFIAAPEVFLLDEPASGVNPSLLVTLSDCIRTMYAERPRVFLLVEHNMEFVMSLAGDIIVMHQGAVLERGTPEAVQASPRVIEAYLG